MLDAKDLPESERELTEAQIRSIGMTSFDPVSIRQFSSRHSLEEGIVLLTTSFKRNYNTDRGDAIFYEVEHVDKRVYDPSNGKIRKRSLFNSKEEFAEKRPYSEFSWV